MSNRNNKRLFHPTWMCIYLAALYIVFSIPSPYQSADEALLLSSLQFYYYYYELQRLQEFFLRNDISETKINKNVHTEHKPT